MNISRQKDFRGFRLPIDRLRVARMFLARPAGQWMVGLLGLLILLAPVWLFADSLAYSRLVMDDFHYIDGSLTLSRTLANLFTPHNTHIVPLWRLLTWGLIRLAGSLAAIPWFFGWAAMAVVWLVMIAVGVLVTRETRHSAVGLMAMAAAGTSSILKLSETWYSASQTFWAGLGVLMTLLALQSWRQAGGISRLVMAALGAAIAGWFWTIGHVAGFAGAAYLLADGSPRCRRAAVVPLISTIASVTLSLALAAGKFQVEVKFEGSDHEKAINFARGTSHTLQSISETLIIGNLGVACETSPGQASMLTLALLGFWIWTFRNGGWPSPLEAAGGVIVGLSYFVTWSFRGYYEFINLRGVVPWYDTVPHLGAVLFASGWWCRVWNPRIQSARLSRLGVCGVAAFVVALIVIHQPRATRLFLGEVPKMNDAEARALPIPELQRYRALILAERLANWQRDHLYRLERAGQIARQAGIGRDLVHKVFGRILTPNISGTYDAVDLLNLPATGRETSESRCRALLQDWLAVPPEPRFPLEVIMQPARR